MGQRTLLAVSVLLLATQAAADGSSSTSTTSTTHSAALRNSAGSPTSTVDVSSATAVTLWPLTGGHTATHSKQGHARPSSGEDSTRSIDVPSESIDELPPLAKETSRGLSSNGTPPPRASSGTPTWLPLTEEMTATTTSWTKSSYTDSATTTGRPLTIESPASGLSTGSLTSTSDALAVGESNETDGSSSDFTVGSSSSTSDPLAIETWTGSRTRASERYAHTAQGRTMHRDEGEKTRECLKGSNDEAECNVRTDAAAGPVVGNETLSSEEAPLVT